MHSSDLASGGRIDALSMRRKWKEKTSPTTAYDSY
jgi:hypothetical protein